MAARKKDICEFGIGEFWPQFNMEYRYIQTTIHAQQLVIIQWMDSCIPKEEKKIQIYHRGYTGDHN
jgi:predicted CoA-binding protein